MSLCDVGLVLTDIGRKYLQLNLITDIGPIRLHKLLHHFGSLDEVMSASISQLERVNGIGSKIATSIVRGRQDDSADREIALAAEQGVRIVCIADDNYPKPLRNISDPPVCLYIRGEWQPTDCVAVAIVGTRRCSHYGQEQAIRFSELLASSGFTVVSGLARGIDGYAHQGALKAGGRTVAVLGNGLTSIYPQEHESLAEKITQSGAVISEFPLTAGPEPGNFPSRNRIIAGLSLGVIVIEAGKRSGALITARLAMEYNREVFALPGRVDRPDLTAGVNGLIRDGGAKLITCMEDVLDELGEVGQIMGREDSTSMASVPKKEGITLPQLETLAEHERAVFDAIENGAEEIDSVCSIAKLKPNLVLSSLTVLQLRGLIQRLPGNRFTKRTSKST